MSEFLELELCAAVNHLAWVPGPKPGCSVLAISFFLTTELYFQNGYLVFILDSRNEKICGNGLRNIDMKKEFALNIIFRCEVGNRGTRD